MEQIHCPSGLILCRLEKEGFREECSSLPILLCRVARPRMSVFIPQSFLVERKVGSLRQNPLDLASAVAETTYLPVSYFPAKQGHSSLSSCRMAYRMTCRMTYRI